MRADELIGKYNMEKHQENGIFIERHYVDHENPRPSSGSIYYYVAPGEHTEFHRIDCDEYWCHSAGSNLEIWLINLSGRLEQRICGSEGNAEPCVRFAKGEIFAARLPENAPDGAFVTCITVPRFTYDGFEVISKKKMIRNYPETEKFYTDI